MKFKSESIEKDWAFLQTPQAPQSAALLVPVALAVDNASRVVAGREALVTGIFRDTTEQRLLLEKRNAQRKAQGLPPLPSGERSVHEFWRGIDFRSSVYRPAEISAIVNMVNKSFTYGGRLLVLAYHLNGSAAHLHGQVPAGHSWEVRR